MSSFEQDSETFKELESFVTANNLTGLREYIMTHPESVNEKDCGGVTLLMVCAASGKLDFCHLLLNLGADINALDRNSFSALMLAAKYGRHQLIKPLIERGANINQRDRTGKTSLAWCSQLGHIEVARVLLDFQAYNP